MQLLILRSVWWDLSPSDLRCEQCVPCHLAKGQASAWLLCPLLRCRKAEPDCLNIFFHVLLSSLLYCDKDIFVFSIFTTDGIIRRDSFP